MDRKGIALPAYFTDPQNEDVSLESSADFTDAADFVQLPTSAGRVRGRHGGTWTAAANESRAYSTRLIPAAFHVPPRGFAARWS